MLFSEMAGALEDGSDQFTVTIPALSMRRSISATARRRAPTGVHVYTDYEPVGSEYLVRVELRRDQESVI
jgi:hypothetical protein